MARRKKRTLTVYNGPPTKEEIDKIIREHCAILEAGNVAVRRALKVGDWFIGCKKRVLRGDWKAWVKSAFPQIGIRQIQKYVQLAEHRQFLEVKFKLNEKRIANSLSDVDFEQVTSMRQCFEAIWDLKRPRKKNDVITGSIRKAIDVEATVSESAGSNGEAERPMRIGLDIETAVAQDNDKLKDSVENPDAPRSPMEEINAELSKSASCLRAASAFWQQALVIAQYHAIPSETVQAKLAEHLDDQSELALCFTTELHYAS